MGRLAQTLCRFRRPGREGKRPWPEHDHGAWKRGAVRRVPKLQPAAQQPNLALHGEAVPPVGIGAAGHKANHRGAFLRCPVGFAHPILALAVGRVHEHGFGAPVLQHAAVMDAVELGTLRIRAIAARVQREAEFLVQRIKQPLWGAPHVGGLAEHHVCIHCVPSPSRFSTSGITHRLTGLCRGTVKAG